MSRRIWLAQLLQLSCVSDCDSQFVVLVVPQKPFAKLAVNFGVPCAQGNGHSSHRTEQGLILQPPTCGICVALSEKSTKRHDNDLKTFLDDMQLFLEPFEALV